MSAVAVLLPLSGLVLLVGIAIGIVGIGGVLLVPLLTYLGSIAIHIAVASCSLSYLFSGTVGAVLYARKGSIRWSMAGWLFAGAMPGAYLGAVTLSFLPGKAVELIIGILIIFAGIHSLIGNADGGATRESFSNLQLAVFGLVTGIGSAITGTGGPLVLVPILIWLRMPVLTAIGLSQVIQVPIAILATIGNFVHGTIDVFLGIGIAVLSTIGVAIGAYIAHRVSALTLKRFAATMLIGVGFLIVARIAHEFL
jgi:uncharacterized membrane protein YfcA